MFFGKFGVRRSVTSGLQPNPPPTRLQSFISHPTSPCTRPLVGSAAAAADCAPPAHLELEKAWLFGRRSWPPPAPVCPQPQPRPVCGATLRRCCHRLRGCVIAPRQLPLSLAPSLAHLPRLLTLAFTLISTLNRPSPSPLLPTPIVLNMPS
jgi:hypothetical protein